MHMRACIKINVNNGKSVCVYNLRVSSVISSTRWATFSPFPTYPSTLKWRRSTGMFVFRGCLSSLCTVYFEGLNSPRTQDFPCFPMQHDETQSFSCVLKTIMGRPKYKLSLEAFSLQLLHQSALQFSRC